MVEYQNWVSICRKVAGHKGADLNDFKTNGQLVSIAASVWNDRKDEILRASATDAAAIADEEITV